MKKILVIVSYQYQPYFSGGQKSIAQFLDYLGKIADVTVIGVPENIVPETATYKHLPWLKQRSIPRYLDTSLVRKLTTLIHAGKFDSVIWEHPYFAWLAAIVKRKTRIETVLHIHNIEYQRFRSTGKKWWRLMKMYERWFFQLSDRLLFVSPEDRAFAIAKWKIDPSKAVEVAFGVEISQYPADKEASKRMVKDIHGIADDKKIFLFNGLLDYKPNLDALLVILNKINPQLLKSNLRYTIIVSGKRLAPALNDLKDYADQHIIYAGFVPDVDMYFKAADLFLNPVQTGGGIKTKMVEAIAFGTTVITTEAGSMGLHRETAGGKLVVVANDDWEAFAREIIAHADDVVVTPEAYYRYYYWGSIVEKLIKTD